MDFGIWLRYIFNRGEFCGEYSCYWCDSDENERSIIIVDSGCSAHMFSDWRVFKNFPINTEIQVNCANGQVIEASGVGNVGFLTDVLLIPQLKKYLF